MAAVVATLRAAGATSVLDLGCGEGRLLGRLLDDSRFAPIVGADVSPLVLERAAERLKLDRLAPARRARIKVADGTALCVPGNHDLKLMRKLNGRDVQITHGLSETLQQLEKETDAFKCEVATFVDALVSHYLLDDGRLVVAHAGMKESMQGRGSGAVRQFALYGESTGEIDEYGLPVRYEWARDYRGGVQPAIKCRGREYLRIIYGPEYLLPRNLERLARPRSEALARHARVRPRRRGAAALRRTRAAVPRARVRVRVLALESEPVDARL